MLEEKKDTDWIYIRRIFKNRLFYFKAALHGILDEHAANADYFSSPSMS